MADWKRNPLITQGAQRAFPNQAPIGYSRGDNALLENTPLGRIEIIRLHSAAGGGLYLVAAQHPPSDLDASQSLSPELEDHLRRYGLRPWKSAQANSVLDVIQDLGRPESKGRTEVENHWSPFCIEMPAGPEIIGRDRRYLVDVLAAMVRSVTPSSPLPAIAGPDGVGRHALAGAVARRLASRAVELPLGRILIDRVLQTETELLMETLREAIRHTQEGQLWVISEAELIGQAVPAAYHAGLLREMSRLPQVLLLFSEVRTIEEGNCLCLRVPGLTDVAEVAALLAETPAVRQLELVGPALEMVVRAATAPAYGILPGRILYLLALSRALAGPETAGAVLTPDEMAQAIDMTSRLWQRQRADVE